MLLTGHVCVDPFPPDPRIARLTLLHAYIFLQKVLIN